MYTCNSCDEYVTADFARVFGDNEGHVHACPACAHMTDINQGAAADRGNEDWRRRAASERRSDARLI